jgi:hypothetical protein
MPRRRGHVDRPFVERFWDKVVFGMECWGWSGAKNEHGYGVLGRAGRGSGNVKAHRASWEIHYGPVPDGLLVLHACDNPQCTNPAHLFLGDQCANMRDASRKGRIYEPGLALGRTIRAASVAAGRS